MGNSATSEVAPLKRKIQNRNYKRIEAPTRAILEKVGT